MVKVDPVRHLDCLHHCFRSIADFHHPFDGREHTLCGLFCRLKSLLHDINLRRPCLLELSSDLSLVCGEQCVELVFFFLLYCLHIVVVAPSEDSFQICHVIKLLTLFLRAIFVNDLLGTFFVSATHLFKDRLSSFRKELILVPSHF